MRTLRELLPKIESDWILPAWLLITIAVAAIAEIITIGYAVQEVYSLSTGWAVGGVIASAQAIGSMLWSRASQHNANRYVRHKTVGPKANRRQVEDKTRSEPALNAWGPGLVSIVAGGISAWLGIAFYSVGGSLTGLDIALAIAAPAGSIAAASLNGVFAYGEAALAEWQEGQEDTQLEKKREKEQKNQENLERKKFAKEKAASWISRRAPNKASREAMLRDGYACYYCGVDMRDWSHDQVHIDHFYPIVRGGTNHSVNLVTSCDKCNLSKGSKIPSKDEVEKFQVHLVKTSQFTAKEKVWILKHCNLLTKQKDIASVLEISPGYVSSSLRKLPDELPELVSSLCKDVTSLGGSLSEPGESLDTSDVVADHLVKIRDRLQAARQAGRANDAFHRSDVEQWCSLEKTRAVNVINYGLEIGLLKDAGNHKYHFTN